MAFIKILFNSLFPTTKVGESKFNKILQFESKFNRSVDAESGFPDVVEGESEFRTEEL